MPIAIEPGITSRVKAYAEAHPEATPKDIGTALGLLTSDVARALQREPTAKGKSKAVEHVTNTGRSQDNISKPGDPGYVSVEESAMRQLRRGAARRQELGHPPTKLDLEIEGKIKLWSE